MPQEALESTSLLELELSDVVVSEDENEELKVPTPPIRASPPPGHLSSLKVTASPSSLNDVTPPPPGHLSSLNVTASISAPPSSLNDVTPQPPGRLAKPDDDMLQVLSKISVGAKEEKMEKRVIPATPDHTSVESWYYRDEQDSQVFGPFEAWQMKMFSRIGKIRATTLVLHAIETRGDWEALNVREFETHLSPTDKFLRRNISKIDSSSWVVRVSDDDEEVDDVQEEDVDENEDTVEEENKEDEDTVEEENKEDEIEDKRTPSRRSLTFDERKLAWIEEISQDEKDETESLPSSIPPPPTTIDKTLTQSLEYLQTQSFEYLQSLYHTKTSEEEAPPPIPPPIPRVDDTKQEQQTPREDEKKKKNTVTSTLSAVPSPVVP